MNVFGVGLGEILAILVIALLVVGPERMVQLSQQLGRMLGKLRRETDSITKEFREAISLDLNLEEELTGKSGQAAGTSTQKAAATKSQETSAVKELSPPEPAAGQFVDGEVQVDRSAERAAAEAELLESDEPLELEIADVISDDDGAEPVVLGEPVVVIEEGSDDQTAADSDGAGDEE